MVLKAPVSGTNMRASRKEKMKDSVEIENVDIDEPTVDIGTTTEINDSVTVTLNPIEYRRKKMLLRWFAMNLSNAPIAYLGKTVYKIDKCIDYFYNLDPQYEDAAKKSIASAIASGDSCAILVDKETNFYVCSLNLNIWYKEIHTADDFSSQYGGLTYLETGGRKFAANTWIKFLITSDGYILAPVVSKEDYIEGNAYYWRLHLNEKYESDLAAFLVYQAKSGELEEYVKGKVINDGL